MPNVLILNGNPTSGGSDGTLVTDLNPIKTDVLLAGANRESLPIKLAIRTAPRYQREGPIAIDLQGVDKSRWALAPDDGGSPGVWGNWGDALIVASQLQPSNTVFWAKARVTVDEYIPIPEDELTVDLVVADDAYQLQIVGKSLVAPWTVMYPGGVGKSLSLLWKELGVVGRSLDLDWEVHEAIGKSLDLRWASGGVVGQSLGIPWVVTNAVGKSLVTPWTVKEAIGKSLSMPWAVLQSPTRGAAETSILCLFLNEGTGTSSDDKSSGSLHDATLVSQAGLWSATGSPWGDPCVNLDGTTHFAVGSTWGGANPEIPGKNTSGTVELIIKFDSLAASGIGNMKLLYGENRDSDNVTLFKLGMYDDKLRFSAWKTTVWNTVETAALGLSTGVWYHIAITWSGSSQKIYLNGVEVTTAAQAGKHDYTGAMYPIFGKDYATGNATALDGKYAFVRAWNVQKDATYLLAAKTGMLG